MVTEAMILAQNTSLIFNKIHTVPTSITKYIELKIKKYFSVTPGQSHGLTYTSTYAELRQVHIKIKTCFKVACFFFFFFLKEGGAFLLFFWNYSKYQYLISFCVFGIVNDIRKWGTYFSCFGRLAPSVTTKLFWKCVLYICKAVYKVSISQSSLRRSCNWKFTK